MLFARRILRVFCLIMLVGLTGLSAQALAVTASHEVRVTVPEVCRYRIETEDLQVVETGEVIQQVTVSVLSNSPRRWKLQAQPQQLIGLVEWSKDGVNWRKLGSNVNTLLQGEKTFWNKYQIYYRYQANLKVALNINYQVFLAE